MTLVVGTAGHIDHGKTSLLRALTGIDADRLPEERRRGMTIDVGYAHLTLPDGSVVDFVDVPGHDRLIGNMLVGAGEIDAAMLVVAADDGPRAQTLEHLELLDGLTISEGLAVVTKTDLVPYERTADVTAAVRALLESTSLRGIPVLPASSATGEGIDGVRAALADLRGRAAAVTALAGPPRLAIDRAFSVRGRGVVVTGTLRGGPIARNDVLRVEPIGREVRVREVQVHNRGVDRISGGGRTALNLVGIEGDDLRRGFVLTAGPAGVERSDRLLIALRVRTTELRPGMPVRLHLGTDQVDGTLRLDRRAAAPLPDGGTTAIVRLDRPIAVAFGDRFVLRRPSPGETLAGGRVLDPLPPRGISRRLIDPPGLVALAAAADSPPDELQALVHLHGALPVARIAAWAAATGTQPPVSSPTGVVLDDAVRAGLERAAVEAVAASPDGLSRADVRAELAIHLRRLVSIERPQAAAEADAAVERLVTAGDLVRDGDRLKPRGSSAGPSEQLLAAMTRLEQTLAVPSPPALSEAARAAGCPAEGIRNLEQGGRIVRVEDDLAWEAATHRRLEEIAVRLATPGPLTPAAYRDATNTSRRYALAILEDLDRRGILRRTPAGHVPGPRAASARVPA